MQQFTAIHLPLPCQESWDAMTPTADGRHCAACQKTVVDFTQKTDAEILALLAQAAGQTCGRFGNDQLNRPLLAAASHSASRLSYWRAWLALAVAAWGLRASSATASAHLPTSPHATHPRKKAGPPPARPTSGLVRGTVRDAATHEPLAGVAVFLKGENRSAITDANGHFSLQPPVQRPRHTLILHFTGYQSQTVQALAPARQALPLELLADPVTEVEIVGYMSMTRQERLVSYGAPVVVNTLPVVAPATAPMPRSFWHRLTQPFRH